MSASRGVAPFAVESASSSRLTAAARFILSSPGQTFVLFPVATIVFETLRRRALPRPKRRFLPLLAWGYTQYRLCGRYRQARGGGGPGIARPPERLVTTGPYALSRNPMYLGHLIFVLGLALAFRSPLATALSLSHTIRFWRRVQADEERLSDLFGDQYHVYQGRVKRWIPGLF